MIHYCLTIYFFIQPLSLAKRPPRMQSEFLPACGDASTFTNEQKIVAVSSLPVDAFSFSFVVCRHCTPLQYALCNSVVVSAVLKDFYWRHARFERSQLHTAEPAVDFSAIQLSVLYYLLRWLVAISQTGLSAWNMHFVIAW